ncbi:hypothetical protein OGAPHI_005688 [Ogataea philodendri]|uniref:Uncharacterized protein n=1 Tax=Ogataea philodendri TaxID=1378263 RepID=A0A9P8T272_9ASCO|nr:uncharacterized protein OGAPHI_005688 [Ogataea philodendri]KAH3662436.1 hypothetical protein OGAPHI_005688 [Ogataea philodendri]
MLVPFGINFNGLCHLVLNTIHNRIDLLHSCSDRLLGTSNLELGRLVVAFFSQTLDVGTSLDRQVFHLFARLSNQPWQNTVWNLQGLTETIVLFVLPKLPQFFLSFGDTLRRTCNDNLVLVTRGILEWELDVDVVLLVESVDVNSRRSDEFTVVFLLNLQNNSLFVHPFLCKLAQFLFTLVDIALQSCQLDLSLIANSGIFTFEDVDLDIELVLQALKMSSLLTNKSRELAGWELNCVVVLGGSLVVLDFVNCLFQLVNNLGDLVLVANNKELISTGFLTVLVKFDINGGPIF